MQQLCTCDARDACAQGACNFVSSWCTQAIPQVLPLEGLLRLLAGERVVLQRRAEVPNGNAELIEGLKRTGMLTSESVTRVMLAVPRGMFVPRRYAVDAWLDSPIRVEEEDFNISAPHMCAGSPAAQAPAAGVHAACS